MKHALIVGGNSGIGLALALKLLERDGLDIHLVGKQAPNPSDIPEANREAFSQRVRFTQVNLITGDTSFLDSCEDIDTLIYTAGFGRVAPLEELTQAEISNMTAVNFQAAVTVLRHFYPRMLQSEPFYCAVMGSIAGHVASPLFSVYGATKAGLCAFLENANVELAHSHSPNRILDVSPGSLKGTNFTGSGNQLSLVYPVAEEILCRMLDRQTRYIPDYDPIYRGVLDRYHADPMAFGLDSYDYKLPRVSHKPQMVVGYLSGTFDLFHVGHLNLLRRAKEQCDYLIVGVHKSGAWKGKETFIPFEERVDILKSVRYVDQVVESCTEDSDAWALYHYHKLFVGSDYQGTPRFQRYEAYFADKGVQIVYFPYTKSTSSTQLRQAISGK